MKIINKNNVIQIICMTFTLLSLGTIIMEGVMVDGINATQFNMIMMFVLSCISVFILSQHYRLEHFSPLTAIIIQYLIAMGIVFALVWLTSFFSELHRNAYLDIFISFTIPYIIGTVIYYRVLHSEVQKQNLMLKEIKEMNRENK